MNKRIRIVTSSVILGFFISFSAVAAAPASGISLHSTVGDSNISSLQFGAGLGVSSPSNGVRSVSKPSVSELTLTRNVDELSPLFFQALTMGESIGKVEIKRGTLVMELEDVIISGYSVSASDSQSPPTSGKPTESMSLNYTKITYSVNTSGTCFDLTTSEVC